MVTQYPANIDTTITLPRAIDNVTPVQGKIFNDLRDAVISLESELGVKPSNIYGTVRSRLDFLENNMGGTQTLAQVLAAGNVTNTHNIVLSSGTELIFNQNAAVPSAPGSGKGALWVKSTSPTTLVFTDSSGADTTLGSGGGGAQTLAQTLALGNVTGGNNIILSSGDKLSTISAAASSNNPGTTLTIIAGSGDGTGLGGIINITGGTGGVSTDGGDVNVLGGAPGSGSHNGGNATFSGGDNITGPGHGGNTLIKSGRCDGVSGNAGVLQVFSGASANGTGGTLQIVAGDSYNGLAAGGAIFFQSGFGSPPGNINLSASKHIGLGAGSGGSIGLSSGDSNDLGGAGGTISLFCGSGGDLGDGGALNLSSGNGGPTSGAGGDITIQGGSSSVGGNGASINIFGGDGATGFSAGNIILAGSATPAASPGKVQIVDNSSSLTAVITVDTTGLSFFNAPTVVKQAVSGSHGGNSALTSLITALLNYGLITDGGLSP